MLIINKKHVHKFSAAVSERRHTAHASGGIQGLRRFMGQKG